MITLQITRSVENPDYQEPEKQHYGYSNQEPIQSKMIDKNILGVEITEDQFEVIRKAIIENF